MTIEVGNRVAYSVQWLRAVGQSPTGELCHWKGTVLMLNRYSPDVPPVASVQWEHDKTVTKVSVSNLAIVGANTKYATC